MTQDHPTGDASPDAVRTDDASGSDGRADDYLALNVADWDSRTEQQTRLADRQWSSAEPTWGVFAHPESTTRMLTGVDGMGVADLDVLENGCGTAYVSWWVHQRGGRPVAIDPTPGQRAIATAKQAEVGVDFPVLDARGEDLPFDDDSFDVVVSEYGSAIWADPMRWIPEAARVLRPGGELRFFGNHPLVMACSPLDGSMPARESLQRPWTEMYRFDWPAWQDEPPVTEFHLPPGRMIALLRDCGLEVLAYLELTAPEGAEEDTEYGFVSLDWARRWPAEEVWHARLRG